MPLTIKDLQKIKCLSIRTKAGNQNRLINDLYTSDLLSWVIGHVRKKEVVLLTVLNSVNLIAVATLLDLSAIIFCEGVEPSLEVIEKAENEKINLFVSTSTAFHTAYEIKNMMN